MSSVKFYSAYVKDEPNSFFDRIPLIDLDNIPDLDNVSIDQAEKRMKAIVDFHKKLMSDEDYKQHLNRAKANIHAAQYKSAYYYLYDLLEYCVLIECGYKVPNHWMTYPLHKLLRAFGLSGGVAEHLMLSHREKRRKKKNAKS